MADRFSEGSSEEEQFKQEQGSNTRLNWLDIQSEPNSDKSRQNLDSARSPEPASSCKDQFLSHEKNEPYPGYNDQLVSDRKYINDSVDHLAEWVEKGLGLGIGSWGIWAEKFRGSGKYLSKLEYKVNLIPVPSAEQAEKLAQIKNSIETLALAGRTTGAAVLKKEQEELEKQILLRSKLISTGALLAGIVDSQAIDGFIFRKDSPGDGTFCADVLAAPALAWLVPKNLALKTGAILGAHVVGKLYDRWLQPNYIYDPKDENKSTLPTTEINQFRSPFSSLSEKTQSNASEPLIWPQADSSPSGKANSTGTDSIFTREDIETQQANRERQRSELEDQM